MQPVYSSFHMELLSSCGGYGNLTMPSKTDEARDNMTFKVEDAQSRHGLSMERSTISAFESSNGALASVGSLVDRLCKILTDRGEQ